MHIKSLSFFFFFFLSIPEALPQSAQKKIDSLMQVAESANDSVRLRIYNRVSFYYIFNNPQKAKELILKGMKDRKSTRLNSSHVRISYAVFCLKKKNKSE